MYVSSRYENSEPVRHLSPGDVVVIYDYMRVEEIGSQFHPPSTLRSWLAFCDGRFGWICAFNEEGPIGFETITEITS